VKALIVNTGEDTLFSGAQQPAKTREFITLARNHQKSFGLVQRHAAFARTIWMPKPLRALPHPHGETQATGAKVCVRPDRDSSDLEGNDNIVAFLTYKKTGSLAGQQKHLLRSELRA